MLDAIPKCFELFGHTITVEWTDEEILDDNGHPIWGEADFDRNTIVLTRVKGSVDPEILHQTFYHEWTHFALHLIARPELGRDEVFVDLMGSAMHQLQRTASDKVRPAKKKKNATAKKASKRRPART